MFFRFILPAAAIVAVVIAGPAAAQTRVSSANGLGYVTLPAGVERHPLGGDTNDTLSLIVRRPGQTGLDWAGLCMVSIQTPKSQPTMETWTTLSAIYYTDAEAKARTRVSDKGGRFERMLTNKPWTSRTGWSGWFTAYQAVNAKGVSESNVFAGTQLAANIRVVVTCTSSEGESFTASDLTVIEKLSQSVSSY